MINQAQLEMQLPLKPRKRSVRRAGRLVCADDRAAWWFNRMRRLVNGGGDAAADPQARA